MDTITHALSGALLAMATAPGRSPSAAKHMDVRERPPDRSPSAAKHMDQLEQPPGTAQPGTLSRRARLVAGAAAAAFPDIDFVLRAVDTLTYLNLHQGVTHSLLLLPAWALLLAWLFAAISRQGYRWQAFYGIAALGIGIHIGGDLVTAYGTQILAPLSDARFSWPLVFVFDPVVTVILIAGRVAAARWQAQRMAQFAFLFLAGYFGLQAVLQQQAVAIGEAHAHTLQLDAATSNALPQPLSPFHWLIVVQHGDTYYETRVDLAGIPRD